MVQPSDTVSVQTQLDEMTRLLTRVRTHVARTNLGQTSLILRDLNKIADSLKDLELTVSPQMRARQRQVRALVEVGSAINSSRGLKRVLEEVMDRLVALMEAERGILKLRDENGQLVIQTARGIDKVDINAEAFAISNTIVNHVAETGEPILTSNAQKDPRFDRRLSVAAYHLLSILCAPLKLKDNLIGVIYVDNRAQSGMFQQSDLEVISAFSNQAAVAIDNARLFDELQAAYQATLEGWVRALDLKDKETEGHTRRVTALTERLAKSMGVDDDLLEHIRRGALLHDIGKMAIPDRILLKPGELTAEERFIIQQHPRYAYEMLSPIKFLLPALDIPYCHHEKWDGSGYPRKLKRVEIPLAARIFSIVDVWDALISDRPYRKGLDPFEIRGHIAGQSGTHFDPHVVEAFMDLKDLSVSSV